MSHRRPHATTMMFEDREQAGERLAEALGRYASERPIVLGIPRGGVPVAAEVASALGGDLGVVVARKLRAPHQPELAIGAVASDGTSYVDLQIAVAAGADESYLRAEIARQAGDANRREHAFDGEQIPSFAGRTVIVVDDGLATGATAIAALRSVRRRGAGKVVLAVPVAPPDTVAALEDEADEIVCLHEDPGFFAVGQFYLDFRQVEDSEVQEILETFRDRREASPSPATS